MPIWTNVWQTIRENEYIDDWNLPKSKCWCCDHLVSAEWSGPWGLFECSDCDVRWNAYRINK